MFVKSLHSLRQICQEGEEQIVSLENLLLADCNLYTAFAALIDNSKEKEGEELKLPMSFKNGLEALEQSIQKSEDPYQAALMNHEVNHFYSTANEWESERLY